MKQPQASDTEIARHLVAGLRGHARYRQGRWQYHHNGEWANVRGPASQLWSHVDRLRDELPADPYWDRARHRLGNTGSTYTLLSLAALDLWEPS